MATKTTCDKCGKELTPSEIYKLTIGPTYFLISSSDNQDEYDLCSTCSTKVRWLIEDFIYPKED